MPDLNRRDAIRFALGMGDRIAMEREQQSAIDIVRGPVERTAEPTPGPGSMAPPAAPPRSFLGRLAARLPFVRRGPTPED